MKDKILKLVNGFIDEQKNRMKITNCEESIKHTYCLIILCKLFVDIENLFNDNKQEKQIQIENHKWISENKNKETF
jgi:hypothetical protein